MVTKLDRLSRSVVDARTLVDGLLQQGIKVYILNMGQLDNSPNGKLTRNIFAAFAEFERDQIVARTQEGKAYKRANNPDYKEGRKPKLSKPQQEKALRLLDEGLTQSEVADLFNISKRTLQRYKAGSNQEQVGELKSSREKKEAQHHDLLFKKSSKLSSNERISLGSPNSD